MEKVEELTKALEKVRDSEEEDKVGMFKGIVDEMFDDEKTKREIEER